MVGCPIVPILSILPPPSSPSLLVTFALIVSQVMKSALSVNNSLCVGGRVWVCHDCENQISSSAF